MEKFAPLILTFFCRVSRRLFHQKRFRDDMAHRISNGRCETIKADVFAIKPVSANGAWRAQQTRGGISRWKVM
jgi:hypothetical protein